MNINIIHNNFKLNQIKCRNQQFIIIFYVYIYTPKLNYLYMILFEINFVVVEVNLRKKKKTKKFNLKPKNIRK